MGHLLGAVDLGKLDEQRGVVQNEKRQGENQPYGVTRQLITENTYPVGHPYSWSTIGRWRISMRPRSRTSGSGSGRITARQTRGSSVAGDIDPETAKRKVETYFGDIPAGPPSRVTGSGSRNGRAPTADRSTTGCRSPVSTWSGTSRAGGARMRSISIWSATSSPSGRRRVSTSGSSTTTRPRRMPAPMSVCGRSADSFLSTRRCSRARTSRPSRRRSPRSSSDSSGTARPRRSSTG